MCVSTHHSQGGEDYDARLWPTGWDQPQFNDAGWSAARVWGGPGCSLKPQDIPPMKAMETLTTIAQWHPNNTQANVVVHDLGKNFAGWPVLRVQGSAGTQLRMTCGELLTNGSATGARIPFGTPVQDGSPNWFQYTLQGTGTVETWRPRFSFYGFRWVMVEVVVGTTPAMVEIAGEAVFSSADQVGHFNSSSALYNDIHRLVMQSMKGNFGSVWMDCPHREKLGWLEVSHLMAPGVFVLFCLFLFIYLFDLVV